MQHQDVIFPIHSTLPSSMMHNWSRGIVAEQLCGRRIRVVKKRFHSSCGLRRREREKNYAHLLFWSRFDEEREYWRREKKREKSLLLLV